MAFDVMRQFVLDTNFSLWGVPVTVTRPAPDSTPIEATGVWLPAADETPAFGRELARKQPRKVLVVRKSEVPTVPRGTSIAAAELDGGDVLTWSVDGMSDPVYPDHFRLLVSRAG